VFVWNVEHFRREVLEDSSSSSSDTTSSDSSSDDDTLHRYIISSHTHQFLSLKTVPVRFFYLLLLGRCLSTEYKMRIIVTHVPYVCLSVCVYRGWPRANPANRRNKSRCLLTCGLGGGGRRTVNRRRRGTFWKDIVGTAWFVRVENRYNQSYSRDGSTCLPADDKLNKGQQRCGHWLAVL